jgi:hypothetical protein
MDDYNAIVFEPATRHDEMMQSMKTFFENGYGLRATRTDIDVF